MYKVRYSKAFKKSLKRIHNSGLKNIREEVIEISHKISCGIKLDQRLRDHQLSGKWDNFRECHVKSDLLLIYKIEEDELVLVDIGSHSQLFK